MKDETNVPQTFMDVETRREALQILGDTTSDVGVPNIQDPTLIIKYKKNTTNYKYNIYDEILVGIVNHIFI